MRYGSLAGPFQTPNRFEGGDGPKAATWQSWRSLPLAEGCGPLLWKSSPFACKVIHTTQHIIKQNSSIKKWMVDSVVGAYMP
jgi:hypothetical protein